MAAALYFANGGEIKVIGSLGAPRETDGIPDIFHFALPENINCKEIYPNDFLAKKITGYMLRKAIEPKNFESSQIYSVMTSTLSSVYLSGYLRKAIRIKAASDVGYAELNPGRSTLLLGYFQSYKYLANQSFESGLTLIKGTDNPYFLKMKELARSTKPLVVHMRFKDYLKESKFGILDSHYYESGLSYLFNQDRHREVWVFSDDEEIAQEKFPHVKGVTTRFFESKDLSPASVLEIMRYGRAYLIANSTFSWWGARLSFCPNAMVVAPKKWFGGMKDPMYILPKNWIKL
jgi:hypothetical protein